MSTGRVWIWRGRREVRRSRPCRPSCDWFRIRSCRDRSCWANGPSSPHPPRSFLGASESVGHVSRGLDQTPAGEPASLCAVVVVSGIGHAGGTGVGAGEVDLISQFDQGNVVLNGVGLVELRVHDDLFDLHVFFGSVVVLLVPFSNADAEFGGVLGGAEAVGGAKDPARGD